MYSSRVEEDAGSLVSWDSGMKEMEWKRDEELEVTGMRSKDETTKMNEPLRDKNGESTILPWDEEKTKHKTTWTCKPEKRYTTREIMRKTDSLWLQNDNQNGEQWSKMRWFILLIWCVEEGLWMKKGIWMWQELLTLSKLALTNMDFSHPRVDLRLRTRLSRWGIVFIWGLIDWGWGTWSSSSSTRGRWLISYCSCWRRWPRSWLWWLTCSCRWSTEILRRWCRVQSSWSCWVFTRRRRWSPVWDSRCRGL